MSRQRKNNNSEVLGRGEDSEETQGLSLYESDDGRFRGSFDEVVAYEKTTLKRHSLFGRLGFIHASNDPHFNGAPVQISVDMNGSGLS
jgi:hypothetical protein